MPEIEQEDMTMREFSYLSDLALYFESQRQPSFQPSVHFEVSPHSVQLELAKLLRAAQPSLSAEALYQKGMSLYRQMEEHIPYSALQGVYMTTISLQSLVDRALKQSGNYPLVEESGRPLSWEELRYSQSSGKTLQTTDCPEFRRPLRNLLKGVVSRVCALFRV